MKLIKKLRKTGVLGSVIFGGVLLVICLLLFVETFSIRTDYDRIITLSDAVMPQLFILLSIVFTCLGIGEDLLKANREKDANKVDESENTTGKKLAFWEKPNGKLVLSIASLFFTWFFMDILSFFVVMVLFLVFNFFLLAPRDKWNPPLFISLGVVVPLAIHFLFLKGFAVLLPTGILKNILS